MHRDENDWGCPDWQDRDAYGDTDGWDALRWRWEFKRRTQGIRWIFQREANQDWIKWNPGISIPLRLMWSDEYQDKTFHLSPRDAAYFGFSTLPNPLYSDAFGYWLENGNTQLGSLSARTLTEWHIANAKIEMFGRSNLIGPGQVAIVFDPNQAIEPQLEGLREHLASRTYHTIKPITRTHPEKWLRYLRILDAREQGASWSQCAAELLNSKTAATPQSAADTYKQAERVRDRF